jgi:Mor family transcriptional regulator
MSRTGIFLSTIPVSASTVGIKGAIMALNLKERAKNEKRNIEIKVLHREGVSYAKLAKRFGLSRGQIGRIVNGDRRLGFMADILEAK